MSTFSNNPKSITLEEIESRKGTEWYELTGRHIESVLLKEAVKKVELKRLKDLKKGKK